MTEEDRAGLIVQTHASWKVACVVAEVSTQPSVTPEPSPASRHSMEQKGRAEQATWSLAGEALPVIQQEEEGGHGHCQLEPAPVWDGVGHPGKPH